MVKSYQVLSKELDTILAELQSPEISIDQALELYEQGQKTLIELKLYLKSAENKIRKLSNVNSD